MKKYTVVMMFPDYLADIYGQDSVNVPIHGENPEKAVRNAQQLVADDFENVDPNDFFVVFVCEGWHEDLTP